MNRPSALVIIACTVAAPALAAPRATCPENTESHERVTAEATERWCILDGKRHGPRQAWYKNEQQWFVGEYRHGKRVGTWRFWHPNGERQSAGTYLEDTRHGLSEHWHSTGAIAMSGHCTRGVEDGLWVKYYPTGKKELEITFINGEPKTRTYYSRRGKAIPLDVFVGEKVRGAPRTSEKWNHAARHWGRARIFDECGL